jgi:hypothetical protein
MKRKNICMITVKTLKEMEVWTSEIPSTLLVFSPCSSVEEEEWEAAWAEVILIILGRGGGGFGGGRDDFDSFF